jgi:hypothetical protein
MRGTAARLLIAVMLGAPGLAGAGTCTVSSLYLMVRNTGTADALVPVGGFVIPTTIDETAGTLAFDLSTFPNTLFNITVDVELDFPPNGVFAGTIDAAGNVSVPNLEIDFLPHIGAVPEPIVASPTLTTGIGIATVGGKDYPTEGVPLDFGTGLVTIQGHVLVPDPPNFNAPVTTGLSLKCTLDPPPDTTKLPKAPALAHAGGKGKLGKAPAPTDTTVEGDKLTLHAVLTQGTHALDPTASDVFVRLRDSAGADVALVWVPAGGLTVKGKTLSVIDKDGSKLHVPLGHKNNPHGTLPPLSGSLTLKRTKTGFKLALKESGLDLSTLASGNASVTVGIGTITATDAVTVVKKGSKVTLK